jgi:hypothetical protein
MTNFIEARLTTGFLMRRTVNMNTGNELLDAFPFHDAVLNNILFDFNSDTLCLEVENEIKANCRQVLSIKFRGIQDFTSDVNDLFKISEIYNVDIVMSGDLSAFNMVVLLSHGPSGQISFHFSAFEVNLLSSQQ